MPSRPRLSLIITVAASLGLVSCSSAQEVSATAQLRRSCGPTDAVGLQLTIPLARGEIDLFAPGWPDERGEVFTMEPGHRYAGLVIARCDTSNEARNCTEAERGLLEIASEGAIFAGLVEAEMPDGEELRVRFTATETEIAGPPICG